MVNALYDPNAFDIFGAYQQGREAYQGNALRQFMAQNGEALLNGDPAALAQIAQYDPELAFQLQSGIRDDRRADRSLDLQQQLLSQRAAHQDRQFRADEAYRQEQLSLAREEGRRAAEEHSANMDAKTRAAALEELQIGMAGLNQALQQGPEAYAAWQSQFGDTIPEGLRSLEPEALLEFGTGMLEGLEGGAAPTDDTKEYEYYVKQEQQAGRAPQPFQNWMKSKQPQTVSAPPAGYSLQYDDLGRVSSMAPIPGSPAALEAEAAAKAAEARTESAQRSGDIVIEDIGRAKKLVEGAPWFSPATGMGSNVFKNVGGTNAADLKALTDTIAANVGFDRLQQMRNESPTGGALGAVSQREMDLLASVLGSLEQSQSEAQMVENLDRLNKVYNEIVHGPGGAQQQKKGGVRFRYDPESGELVGVE